MKQRGRDKFEQRSERVWISMRKKKVEIGEKKIVERREKTKRKEERKKEKGNEKQDENWGWRKG